MSILQKQRMRDPQAGYARDFVDLIARVLPDLKDRRVRVIANAGGINPLGCRDAVLETGRCARAYLSRSPPSPATTSPIVWISS